MKIISMIADGITVCESLGLTYGLVGNDIIVGECSGIEDSTEWTFYDSFEEARDGM